MNNLEDVRIHTIQNIQIICKIYFFRFFSPENWLLSTMLTDPINPDLCRAWILLFSCFIKTLAFHSSSFHGINLNDLFSSAKVSEQGMGRRSSITDKMRGPRHYNWSCFFDKLSSSNWQSSQITNHISCWVLLPSYKSSRKTQLTSTKAWLCFCKVAENWLYVWLILTWLADIRESCAFEGPFHSQSWAPLTKSWPIRLNWLHHKEKQC